ncbi:hypothetical protein JHK82_016243 [Glycine max]|nr:hypothetical protein JHK85_016650 [Glycine max]KAG5046874.1 hypothetical protein JHK86_016280 [Glycine max]KAG5149362.1 hypothetical protein JHK82_016243 [Glycine max]
MDISSSQYNSAGESGWTHYLDYSSLSESYFQMRGGIEDHGAKGARVEEEEEDLSMISDASSGPQHYHEDDGQHYCVNCSLVLNCPKASQKAIKKASFSGNGTVENALDFSPMFLGNKNKVWNNIREYKKLKRVSDSIFLDAIRDRHA